MSEELASIKEPVDSDSTVHDRPASESPQPTPSPRSGSSARRSFTRGREVSLSLATILRGAALALLVVALGVVTTLWWSGRGDLHELQAATSDRDRAQEVAMAYAVGASNIDNADFQGWVNRLKSNTSSQLANKFDATAPKLEQILVPLKWNSSAKPISAVVASEANGVYKVNAFVNVTSTSAQTPDGGQMTVTYNVTVDKASGWKITDVGGLDGALPIK